MAPALLVSDTVGGLAEGDDTRTCDSASLNTPTSLKERMGHDSTVFATRCFTAFESACDLTAE
ncbi:hypothetical protein KIPB_015999, partial [Kipferlia bialata]|eukprot:g15999.t1